MVTVELDPYPVSELTTRFRIGRTALYDRMKALSILPIKQGNKAFVSKAQLQRLDDLDAHLKEGGALGDFEPVLTPAGAYGEPDEQAYLVSPNALPGKLSRSQDNGVFDFRRLDVRTVVVVVREGVVNPLISGLKETLLVVFPAPLSRVERGLRLSHLRELEEAYEKGWLLSTAELADLLGLSVKTVRGYGEQFEQAGFSFTRSHATTRSRGEVAWQVGKLSQV